MVKVGFMVNGQDRGETIRINASCPHQNAVIYVVPAERSWVCTPELLHAHALAGFFKGLLALQDPKITALMQEWGIYCRELPLEVAESGTSEESAEAAPAIPA